MEKEPSRIKRLLGPRMRYALFVLGCLAVIAAGFNTFFALKFHHEFVRREMGRPGYRHHDTIGYEIAPGFEESWPTYFCKSHELGFRIGKGESATEVVPGGLLAIGDSFTYGDAVEHEETFAKVAADALGLPVYNYGVASYSYATVLLQLRHLESSGLMDRLAPSVILLGAGNWLVDRSLTPLYPTEGLNFGYSYIARRGDGLAVVPPPDFYAMKHFWTIAERYYPPGTDWSEAHFSWSRFATMFAHAPRVLAARADRRLRFPQRHSDISSEELYRFVLDEIDAVAGRHEALFVVLWMPLYQLEVDPGLSRTLKLEHPLVSGGEAIRKHGVPAAEYVARHPSALAHAAYGAAIAEEMRSREAAADER